MLNMTKIKIGLISDLDMYTLLEKGMEGGFSYVSNRCSKANNKYLKSDDPKQESKHITQTRIICMAMRCLKFLPTSGFEWIDPKKFDLNKYASNSSKGCVLEVDLEYPKSYKNYIMIIHQHQIQQKSKDKFYPNTN